MKPAMNSRRGGAARVGQAAPEPPLRKVLRVLKSAAAALLGVQSHANRERDFQSDSIVPFAIAGIILTVVLMGTLTLVVSQIVD